MLPTTYLKTILIFFINYNFRTLLQYWNVEFEQPEFWPTVLIFSSKMISYFFSGERWFCASSYGTQLGVPKTIFLITLIRARNERGNTDPLCPNCAVSSPRVNEEAPLVWLKLHFFMLSWLLRALLGEGCFQSLRFKVSICLVCWLWKHVWFLTIWCVNLI